MALYKVLPMYPVYLLPMFPVQTIQMKKRIGIAYKVPEE